MSGIFAAARTLAARLGERHALLFVIPGGSGGFPSVNLDLYRRDRAFRESIEAAGAVVETMLGWNAVAAFRGEPERPATPEVARRNELVHHGLTRIALIDQWTADGIVPDGAIGVSLGEVIAPYAVGAISREDCARLVTVVAQALMEPPFAYRTYVVEAAREHARRLCRTAPVPIDFLGTSSPKLALVLCAESAADAARAWFGDGVVKEAPSGWPYHTPSMYWNADWATGQLGSGATAHHGARPIYSPAVGGLLPPGTRFDARCARWMMTGPSYFAEAVSAALADGFDTFVQVTARPMHVLADVIKTAEAKGRQVRQLYAFEPKARSKVRGMRRFRIPPSGRIRSAPPPAPSTGSDVGLAGFDTEALAELLLRPLTDGKPFDVVSALADPLADTAAVDGDALRRVLASAVLQLLRDGPLRQRVREDPELLLALAGQDRVACAALRALLRCVPDFTVFQPLETVTAAPGAVLQLMIAR